MTMLDPPRKSAWIPWVFVGAMSVVVAVNAVMVTYALKSWSGLAVEKPYERGVNYNAVLAAQHRQDRLGWAVATAVREGRLEVRVIGTGGIPLEDLTLTGELERPVGRLEPVPLRFENAGNGVYVASLTGVTQPGQWDVRARLERGTDHYLLVERVFVK